MYSIIELQTTDGTTVHNYQTAETKAQAMSVYHTTLAYAALSEVEVHTCIVVDEKGQYIARECYEHPKAVEKEVSADEAKSEETTE